MTAIAWAIVFAALTWRIRGIDESTSDPTAIKTVMVMWWLVLTGIIICTVLELSR